MILDLHAVQAIASGCDYYRTRQAEFNALFVGVGTSTLSAWYAAFSTDQFPLVRSHTARGTAQAPLITINPQAESVAQELVGEFAERVSGVTRDTYMIREGVELVVFARTPDMARVYHVVVRASVALSRRAMHRAGYHVWSYGGAQPLNPEEDLAAEELGIYVRRLTLSAEYQVHVPIPAAAEFTVSTYEAEQVLVLTDAERTNDGTQGGVSPLVVP